MTLTNNVWIFAETPQALPELIGGGRQLGQEVTALIVGERGEAERAIHLGADCAFWLGETGPERLVEDYVESVAALLREHRPDLLLLRATTRGKVVAGRLAALLGTAVLTDVKEFGSEEDVLTARHMLYGGGAERVERVAAGTALATVGAGTFEAAEEDASRSGNLSDAEFVPTANPVKLLERRPKESAGVDLTGAKRVIGVGRGVAKQEDLEMVGQLAQALDAEIACSRPIAEGLGWLPRERYLGVSGAVIKPELYLALGISGQMQHMVGVSDAQIIVAVNKDKNAPIFELADYGIAGDLYKVVPALIAALGHE